MTNKELHDSIIFQDASFLIANKPAGIAAQQDPSKDDSFHEALEKFSSTKLFVVHRLDRPTSGIMVFAKKKKAASHYGKLIKKNEIEKTYFAAVKNAPKVEQGELNHYLFHDSKQRKSIVSEKANKDAKHSTLEYKVLDSIENYTLLEIKLKTGRFHQIRAQLAAVGSPIKGDVKYGARRSNKDRSINLHSGKLSFPLLYGLESINISARFPNEAVWNAFSEKNTIALDNKYEKWTTPI